MKTGIFLFAVLAVVVTSHYNIADEIHKRMAEPPAQTMTYEVQEGDTVWDIAGRHSGKLWHSIISAIIPMQKGQTEQR